MPKLEFIEKYWIKLNTMRRRSSVSAVVSFKNLYGSRQKTPQKMVWPFVAVSSNTSSCHTTLVPYGPAFRFLSKGISASKSLLLWQIFSTAKTTCNGNQFFRCIVQSEVNFVKPFKGISLKSSTGFSGISFNPLLSFKRSK